LLQSFWMQYLQARLLSGDDTPFGDASVVFEEPVLRRMHVHFAAEVMSTPVFFTDKLSNQVAAGCLVLRGGSCVVAINVRFALDPEVLAHTLIEEFAHSHQIRQGVDFASQQRRFPYAERPYEQEAKHFATEILGYQPDEFDVLLLREEPPGLLFDHPRR